MEALICSTPNDLAIGHVSRPDCPDGWVRLKVRRVGICGTDYHIYEGKQPFLSYPRIMGHEIAAEVIDPNAAEGVAVGDIVIINPYLACGTCRACEKGRPNCCYNIEVLGVHRDGAMCEEIVVPARNLVPANGLSLDACATVEFLAIGAHAVARAQTRAGDRVLVVGAGPIGIGAGLFARLAGAEVTLLDIDRTRVDGANAIVGAPHTIVLDDTVSEKVAALTDGFGYDVVFDATGNKHSMEASFAHVAHCGRYALVGVMSGDITFADPEFHKREMTLLASRNALNEDFARVAAHIAAGDVPLDRLITHRTTLHGAVEDLPRWSAERSTVIKAMISLD